MSFRCTAESMTRSRSGLASVRAKLRGTAARANSRDGPDERGDGMLVVPERSTRPVDARGNDGTTSAYKWDYPRRVMRRPPDEARMRHGYGAEVPVTAKLFEIRVRGTVPEDVLADAGGMRVVAEPAQTVLRGSVRDQAALQGLLSRLHDLGLELVEVRRLHPAPQAGAAADRP